jgi:hypothetical protein
VVRVAGSALAGADQFKVDAAQAARSNAKTRMVDLQWFEMKG